VDKKRKAMLDVLQGHLPERTPIWLMRQAGRYLPEYRNLRAKAKDFLNMCLTPEWAAEVTLQPLRRFDLDAAIIFADILLVPMALGNGLEFREGEGPVLEKITGEPDLQRLKFDDAKVQPVYETLRRVKKELSPATTLIGFCGAPWTVACYMIDGTSKTGFADARRWVKDQPETLQRLVSILVDASEVYLGQQIKAGAEVLQIFDSWGGLLQGPDFRCWVIEPTKELVRRIKAKYPHIPIIGFPREAREDYLPYVRETGIDGLSIDQAVDLDWAKMQLQPHATLQGNLDPALLVQGGEAMKQGLKKILTAMGPKHIINLGHGVVPQTPPEHVVDLVAFVRQFNWQ
jgi:uroporphyrinogen decarboxylase